MRRKDGWNKGSEVPNPKWSAKSSIHAGWLAKVDHIWKYGMGIGWVWKGWSRDKRDTRG
jgi:hypothetical protein